MLLMTCMCMGGGQGHQPRGWPTGGKLQSTILVAQILADVLRQKHDWWWAQMPRHRALHPALSHGMSASERSCK